MIKRTLYFGNPAYLSMQNQQLVLRLPEIDKNTSLPLLFKKQIEASVPIEDIGMVVIDHGRSPRNSTARTTGRRYDAFQCISEIR